MALHVGGGGLRLAPFPFVARFAPNLALSAVSATPRCRGSQDDVQRNRRFGSPRRPSTALDAPSRALARRNPRWRSVATPGCAVRSSRDCQTGAFAARKASKPCVAAKKAAGRRLQVTVLARWEPEGGARRCVSSLLCPRLRHVEAILSGASSARSAAFPLSGGMDVKCRIIDRLYPRGSMFRLSIYDVRGERRAIQGERAGGTATKGGHR